MHDRLIFALDGTLLKTTSWVARLHKIYTADSTRRRVVFLPALRRSHGGRGCTSGAREAKRGPPKGASGASGADFPPSGASGASGADRSPPSGANWALNVFSTVGAGGA